MKIMAVLAGLLWTLTVSASSLFAHIPISLSAPPCPADMVAYWQAEGDASDSSRAHDGALVGGTFAAGKVGQCFSLTAGNYIGIASDPDFSVGTSSYTMCAWIRTSYAPGNACIFSRSALGWEGPNFAQYHMEISGSVFRTQVRDDSNGTGQYVSGMANVADNQWHFVAGVVDRSENKVKAYVDGILDGNAALTEKGALTFGAVDLTIGGLRNPSFQCGFAGSIDEVAMYARALGAAEILGIYESSSHYCGTSPTPTARVVTPTRAPPTPTPMPPTPTNILPTPTSLPDNPCAMDMVAYWEAEGDASDSAGDHDGDLIGTSFMTGKVGQAFAVQSDNRVEIPSHSDFNVGSGSYSMCAWIKTNYVPSANCIFGRSALGWESWTAYAQYHIEVAGNHFRVQVRDDLTGCGQYVSGMADVADNQWHFVVGVVDRSESKIKSYVDGGLDCCAPLMRTGPLSFGNVGLTIGGLRNPNFQFGFSGAIDEMAFFKRSLGAEEIRYMYESGRHYCEATPTPGSSPAPTTGTPIPTPPDPRIEASANPLLGNAPLTVDFDGVLTQGGNIASYRWDFDNDGVLDYISTQSLATSHTFGSAGTYFAVCSVIDALGRYAFDYVIVQVSDPIQPPMVEARATPTSGSAPLDVAFSGAVQSSNPIAFYLWDFDDNGVIDWGSIQTAATAHIFGAPGCYTSRLSVVDNSGLMAFDTVYLVVKPGGTPPAVEAFANPLSGTVPLEVGFSGIASPPEDIVLYEWDFDGDGAFDWSSQSDASASHVFAVPGHYEARLRATDAAGLYGEATVLIAAGAPSALKVWISVPKDGWTVSGDAVSIRINTAPGSLTAWVQPQYRPAGEGEWSNLGGEIQPPPYSFDCTWDTTVLSPGFYQLRAKASDTSDLIVYSEPITVQVIAEDGQADENNEAEVGRVKRQAAAAGESARLEIAGGLTLELPYGSLGADATGVLSSLSANPREGRRSRSATVLFSFANVALEGVAGLGKPAVLSVPYADANSDGVVDGTSVSEGDLAIFRFNASAGEWQVVQESTVYRDENFVRAQIMATGDYALGTVLTLPSRLILQSGDYTGDGKADIAVFRGATGLWASRSGERVYLGAAGDTPASGDYDGDGTAERAVYRPSTGLWVAEGIVRQYLGTSGDVSVPADYDGDGTCDRGVFRPASGLWSIPGVTRAYLGTAGDQAVPADYDGNGRSEIGVFRSSSGFWSVAGLTRTYLGTEGDIPLPADYNGDGGAEVAIYRLASGLWSVPGFGRFFFGSLADTPIAAPFQSGPDTAAVFRPATGMWTVRLWTRLYFGSSGDLPVAR